MTEGTRKIFDKYRIIAKLGRGGMADVYLAASHGPGGFSKLLVVKVLQATLAQEVRFLDMFREEARLAARLNHPNIVQTYEVGETEGRHYIAMEYLEGQPLNRVIETFLHSQSLDVATSLRIAIDILSGLQYAHDLLDLNGEPLGIVHRDITPQNIFVTYEGQVKLVDFGIAKAFDSTIETQVGTVKGKVSYMAPEQARGEPVERTADLFSMGVVLWELLAQKRLWQGLTDIAVVGRLVQGDIPNLRTVAPQLPAGLSAIVMSALDPDPKKRPQTARDFQQVLERHFERLQARVTARRLGEMMREEFREERNQVRLVVKKQLDRLTRDTPTGVTPPDGWKLSPPGAGDMPILGEGSRVHDAVTTIHTQLTGSMSPQVTTTASPVTSVTDAQLITQNRNIMWVAIAAVGAAGLTLGLTRPWESLARPVAEARAHASPAANQQQSAASPSPMNSAAHPSSIRAACDSPSKPVVELTGEITGDAELTCEKDYLLRFSTYVSPGSTLKIQPGTTIMGDIETKGTLVIQPGARIFAAGTVDHPIVFTSAAHPSQKKPGDWGGLIVLGRAPLNLKDAQGSSMRGKIEGIVSGGEYGGDQASDSSGVLSYLRIEYSGTEIAPNNEINGLTFGGVGRGTVVDHIQVRHTADDCFEFFGGTVDAKYLICQSPGDDAFDWDYGYTGRLQFLVSQADPKVSSGSNGFEGDNDPGATENRPISLPLIYNFTLCGNNRALEGQEQYGMLLRRGSQVRLRNGIVMGFDAGLDVRDSGTKPNIAASIFYHNGSHNLAYPETSEAREQDRLLVDDDGGFDELNYLKNPGLKIYAVDPHLGNCFDPRAPGYKPQNTLYEGAAIPPRDGFFDHGARYMGAFRDQKDDWDRGRWVAWDG